VNGITAAADLALSELQALEALVCCLLFAVAVCCPLSALYWPLSIHRSPLSVVYCLLFAICCLILWKLLPLKALVSLYACGRGVEYLGRMCLILYALHFDRRKAACT
jgi:hypothetical protein